MEITNYNEDGEQVHLDPEIAHYHGDYVRFLFIAAAVLMMVMQFTGNSPFATSAALIMFVAVLAIAAGITSPTQRLIHLVNLLISLLGLVTFGALATQRLHSIGDFFTHDGLVGIISLIFLTALYLSTRTVRGNMTRSNPVLEATEE